ncbi:MAG TPA: DUF3137 domain-containing protein [Caulobacteraceae bacterium]|nr:DUF3137 domain-containing protein [Caulobacteraceae bacterium]
MSSEAQAIADPLEGAGLRAIYESQIEPVLEQLEIKRKQALRLSRIIWAAVALAAVIELAVGFAGDGVDGAVDAGQYAFATVSLGIGIGFLPLQGVFTKSKATIIGALCRPLGVTYAAEGFQPDGFQGFRDLRLVPGSTEEKFTDLLVGAHAGLAFWLCQATLTAGTGKEARTVFSGQLLQVAYPKPFGGVTVVLRRGGRDDGFQRPQGLQEVGLEDPKFDHVFQVFGDDQVEARVIVTPAFMEHLMALEKAYEGERLRCAFTRGNLLLAVEGASRFYVGDPFSTMVNRARVQSMAADIHRLFGLIDSFTAA